MIYCFIVIIHILDNILRSMDRSLNVTMVNQLLIMRSDNVTVILQWPQEPGAVYSVSVSPEVSYQAELNSMIYIFTISLTIPYDIQHNVSIESSLCGIIATRILKYGEMHHVPEEIQ